MTQPSDPQPGIWHLLDRQLQMDTPIFSAWKNRFRHHNDGREGDFYAFECADWVQAVSLTEDGRLILVEQFRFGSQGFGWELPGGVIDAEDGADPAGAGARELLEETGYAADTISNLGWAYPNPALMSNRVHYLLFEGCKQIASQSTDLNEEIRVGLFTWEQVEALIDEGAITHAITLSGLYAYARYLRRKGSGNAAGEAGSR